MIPELVIPLLLLLFEPAYILAARRMQLYDIPNERSSHSAKIVSGGGIIVYLAYILLCVISGTWNFMLLAALSVLAFVSFADDIRPVPVAARLVVQLAAAGLMLWEPLIPDGRIGLWIIAVVLGTGLMNSFNFMDGINGSVGLYALVTLVTLAVLNNIVGFADPVFIVVMAEACLVFCLFNFRKKALCFAGDVGSIVMGAVVFYLCARLIMATGNIVWLALVSVYGVDTVLTLCRRIFLRENIFKPHRKHAYQIAVNERNFPQLLVAAFISVLQFIINVPLIAGWTDSIYYLIAVIAGLSIFYLLFITGNRQKNSSTTQRNERD